MKLDFDSIHIINFKNMRGKVSLDFRDVGGGLNFVWGSTMDQNDQSTGNGKTYSLQQPSWPGKAQRQQILMKFIQICFGVALLILGAFVLLHP
jgi:hypothetical protein